MMEKLEAVLRTQDRVSEWSEKAISWMVIAMTAVIIYEILARYIFNSPTSWAHEASTMLYGAFCILAGAYTQRFRAHVRSDAVHRLFPRKIRLGLDCFTGLLAIAFLLIFLKISISFAASSWAVLEHSNLSTWHPPLYPFKTAIPIAVLLLLLQQIATFLDDLLVLLKLKNGRERESDDRA